MRTGSAYPFGCCIESTKASNDAGYSATTKQQPTPEKILYVGRERGSNYPLQGPRFRGPRCFTSSTSLPRFSRHPTCKWPPPARVELTPLRPAKPPANGSAQRFRQGPWFWEQRIFHIRTDETSLELAAHCHQSAPMHADHGAQHGRKPKIPT